MDVFRHQFDISRAERDENALKEAQDDAYEEVKVRVYNVERNDHVDQESTSELSSKFDTIIDDHTLIRDLGLNRSEEEHNTYLSRLEHRSIKQLKKAYPPLGK